MAVLPTTNFSDPASNRGQWRGGLNALRDVVKELLGHTPPVSLSIAGGSLTPTAGVHLVDTEASGPTDSLDHLSLSLPEGRLVALALASAARPWRAVHGAVGDGGIDLLDADDLTLAAGEWLLLQRVGTRWQEVRLGVPSRKTIVTPATRDLDMAGYAVTGDRPKAVTISAATWAPATAAEVRGRKFRFTHATGCTVTLPAGTDLEEGDLFYWEQRTPSLKFIAGAGASLIHPLGHYLGLGIGSIGMAWVGLASPREWHLAGMTKPAAGGGVQRSAFWSTPDVSVPTDAGSTAWKEATGLSFPVVSGEKWLWLATGLFSASGSNLNNPGKVRLAIDGGEKILTGRGASNAFVSAVPLMAVQSYGANATAAGKLEIAAAASPYSCTLRAPRLFALKLGANDSYAEQSGTLNLTNGTLADVLTHSPTVSGSCLILAAVQWYPADSDTFCRVGLQVDGVLYDEQHQRNAPSDYAFFGLRPATLTGSSVIKIRAAAGPSTGNLALKRATIVVLKLADFERSKVADAPNETVAYTETTPTDVLTTTATEAANELVNGWWHLVIADGRGKVNRYAAQAAWRPRLTRDGGSVVMGEAAMGNNQVGSYIANPFMAFDVVVPPASLPLALQHSSAAGGDTVVARDATVAVLALMPDAGG